MANDPSTRSLEAKNEFGDGVVDAFGSLEVGLAGGSGEDFEAGHRGEGQR